MEDLRGMKDNPTKLQPIRSLLQIANAKDNRVEPDLRTTSNHAINVLIVVFVETRYAPLISNPEIRRIWVATKHL